MLYTMSKFIIMSFSTWLSLSASFGKAVAKTPNLTFILQFLSFLLQCCQLDAQRTLPWTRFGCNSLKSFATCYTVPFSLDSSFQDPSQRNNCKKCLVPSDGYFLNLCGGCCSNRNLRCGTQLDRMPQYIYLPSFKDDMTWCINFYYFYCRAILGDALCCRFFGCSAFSNSWHLHNSQNQWGVHLGMCQENTEKKSMGGHICFWSFSNHWACLWCHNQN